MIIMDFDVHPQSWERTGLGRNGPYTQDKTREFEDEVKFLMQVQMDGQVIATGCTVVMILSIACKNKKKWGTHKTTRPDNDNYEKAVFDAGNGIVWMDDGLIWSNTTRKYWAETDHIRLEISADKAASETPLVSQKVLAASDLVFKNLDAKIAKDPKLKAIYEKAKKEAQDACDNQTISGEEYLRGVEQ